MEMMPYQLSRAAAIPRTKGGTVLQMKLVYNQLTPLVLLFLQWMDCSCASFLHRYLNLFHIVIYKVHSDGRNMSSHGRKATIGDFYAIILPSLLRLHGSLEKLETSKEGQSSSTECSSYGKKMIVEGDGKLTNVDLQREDECDICLEPCTKMVLPNCCHAMCIRCYRKW
ncbi:hypothetical protein PIB30_075201 [Stylosanthes scabra]|nr:hypothetical protein [Stylosanthes scabra]